MIASPAPNNTTDSASNPPGPMIGIVVNHTHWDREWYMPFQRYRVLLVDAVDLLLDTLRKDPSFTGFMLDGQTAVAEDYLEVRPERRPELEEFIRDSRIVMGPWYVLPDEFIPSGESLIRNLLLGRKQMAELGASTQVGYLPDTFGHPAQLPQILAGFDMQSGVIFRGVQSSTSEFIWEAPDGTRLLTIYLPGGYYNAMELARAPKYWLAEKLGIALDQLAKHATAGVVLLMNGCDHFQPQPATQPAIDEANRLQNRVHLRQGTLSEYVDLVKQANPSLEVKRGEWRYNRPARITPGVMSARMYIKQADFRAATLLERGAEPLQGLAWLMGGHHDTGLLGTAWRYLLQNHPHDSICGCSTDEVHKDCETRFRWTEQIGGDLVERAANSIAKRISTPQAGTGFALFNTLARPRSEVVRQRLHFLEPGTAFTLADSQGRPLPYQEVARRPMKIEWDPQRQHFYTEARAFPAFVVSPHELWDTGGRWRRWLGEEVEVLLPADLPAGGYTVVHVNAANAASDDSGTAELTSGPDWLENAYLRVEAASDGSFSLLDRQTGTQYGPLNVFRSEADRGDEYSFCPAAGDTPVSSINGQAEVSLIEDGPLRATLEISLVMQVPEQLTPDRNRRTDETVPLKIRTRVSLGPTSRRVEISTEVDNTARDHRLRALFTTGVRTAVADAQGQFQVMRRPVELEPEERARVPEFDEEQEVSYHPQRAFVDVSDADGAEQAVGFAVLNRGLPEYEAETSDDGVRLGITLLRCVGWLSRDDLSTRYKHAGPALETPEAQCLGHHHFEYAVMPHAGDWLQGGVAAEAEAYTSPIYSAPLTGENEGTTEGSNTLPRKMSFYTLGPGELLFSACKRSEDGNSLILRVYNTAPYPVEGVLRLGTSYAVKMVNLAERELGGMQADHTGDYRFPVRAHEIVTFSIEPD
ncbi:MAG: glycoside hydrolase family 38 C-terminal domain-containing protein [Chloroflexota bacterium]